MITSDPFESQVLWNNFPENVNDNFSNGSDRKSPHTEKDVLFMKFTVRRHMGQEHFLSRFLNLKGPTFTWLIMRFIRLISDYAFSELVHNNGTLYPMTKMITKKAVFQYHPFSRYATDVT